ncbi:DUF5688 family protein [Enterocloster clostridioformis]|uniref:DUF5688 family protein n=1 Tax=Enterocloster clostridioformis TaxID=1531 RepID=UPI0026775216|nr:DUF5688 family protein [Enterocloster clostridioformis]
MNLTNYDQFKAAYLQKMAELLDQRGYSIRPVMIGEGLSLEKATLDLGNKICHCIDLQEVYSVYCKNARPMFSVAKDALACFREFGTEQREQVESIENVLACVTNYEKSKEILQGKGIPYLLVDDMAVYFRFDYELPFGGTMESIVTKDHLLKWNYSIEEVFNLVRRCEAQLIGACAYDWVEPPKTFDFGHIQVIARAEDIYNAPYDLYGLNGAGAIFYPEVLRQFEEAFHERVIIVPYSERKAAILPESRIQDKWVQRKIREYTEDKDARLLLSRKVYSYTEGKFYRLKGGIEQLQAVIDQKLESTMNHEKTLVGKKQSR